LLTHPSINRANVSKALEAFDLSRRPRTTRVQTTSRIAGDNYEFAGEPGADKTKLKECFDSWYRWIWDVDLEQEGRRAVDELERLLST
jgi:salicylate hydroxylase